jgi:hypothetical protein
MQSSNERHDDVFIVILRRTSVLELNNQEITMAKEIEVRKSQETEEEKLKPAPATSRRIS